tara:strand:+ start:471 stop:950 length:480 start_codon:yes stop_codon:yes gene_type:complete
MTILDCVIQIVKETGVEGWSCGETWESIRLPEGYEKPPKEEFEAKLQVLVKALPWKNLRQERSRRLAEVDWVFSTDYQIPDDKRGVWIAYRQGLRDLPSKTEDPTNPVWPTKPSTPNGTTLNIDLKSIKDREVSEKSQITLLQNVVFSLTKRIEALENA